VSTGVYTLLFLAGAASLALWVNLRAARFAPEKMRDTLLHVGASMVACRIISPMIGGLLTGTQRPELRLTAVIGIALPALTYALLSLVWVIVLIQGTLRRGTLD
jgi:hypothetical protein